MLRLSRLADYAIFAGLAGLTGFTLADGNEVASFIGALATLASYRYIESHYHTLLLDKPE